jgi:hypothetical protein
MCFFFSAVALHFHCISFHTKAERRGHCWQIFAPLPWAKEVFWSTPATQIPPNTHILNDATSILQQKVVILSLFVISEKSDQTKNALILVTTAFKCEK